MKPFLFFCILSSFLFISCNEDDNSSEEQQIDNPNFYALTVGNTWTYEYFERVDNTDEFVTTNAFDEVKILSTSEINGNIYYNFETTTTGNDGAPVCVPPNGKAVEKLRDSLGYLVNDIGTKRFSNTNENLEYLVVQRQNSFHNIYALLVPGSEIINVASVSFECLKNEKYAKLNDGVITPGRNLMHYADEIGQIKETYSSVNGPNHFAERRLVSYNIQD